jgi:hypothetical protein
MSQTVATLDHTVDVPDHHTLVRPTRRASRVDGGRRHWPIAAVLTLFAAAAFIVPTMTPIATTDDWGYSRSTEILYHSGELKVFPVVAATAIFHVVWAWLFALVFGMSLGIVRVSTVVIVALGGLALYGTCRRLGAGHGLSALGAATYLFNPLGFFLTYTFMTDPHFTALMLGATYFYVRGLAPEKGSGWATVVGSAIAAAAFLTRQQGVLIPLAVGAYLLFGRRLRVDLGSVWRLLRVGGIPLLALVGYYIWLREVNDVPAVQTSFLNQVKHTGLSRSWFLIRRVTFYELVYMGLFTLPVVAAALLAGRRLARSLPSSGVLLLCAWEAIVVGGVAIYGVTGRWMPYIPQFLGPGGPGTVDVRGSRPALITTDFRIWATLICGAASVILAVALARGARQPPGNERAGAGVVLAIAIGQVVGVIPPSYHYQSWAGSLDRYLLPLLPLSILLAVWAVRDARIFQPLGWVIAAVFAVVSVVGARDYLVYMDTVWSMARQATEEGVPIDRLDAGSGWDGYHLYELSLAHPTRPRTKNGAWWTSFYAPITDSAYVVSGKPIPGYYVVRRRPYSYWMEDDQVYLYLLRRADVPWPPVTSPTPTASPEPRPTPPPPVRTQPLPPPPGLATTLAPVGVSLPTPTP